MYKLEHVSQTNHHDLNLHNDAAIPNALYATIKKMSKDSCYCYISLYENCKEKIYKALLFV